MGDIAGFGFAILIAALVGLAAVVSSRVSALLRVPAPAFFLLGAAIASDIWPSLATITFTTVERVVTVALVLILFDGGMRIGWREMRTAAAATVWVGVAGTAVTAGALAVAAHLIFSFSWRVALLIGTALAPTDPAVVFSVLGRREIGGRTGVLLEGESGANDPVGISLLIALLAAGGAASASPGSVAVTFVIQMCVGLAVGVVGGRLLLLLMRRFPLPNESLYAMRVLASVFAIYGVTTVAHGSGFLAVFVTGIILGDERAPYKGEIAHFHSSLASLSELVAFVMLGFTISLRDLPAGGAWIIGLVLAALLAIVIRPLLVGLVLWPVRLRAAERVFVLWSGLKGAVPILLGSFIVQSGIKGAPRDYEIIFVVVAFSVVVQGSTVPALARRLRVPLRSVDPEPWSLGVRFQEEPEGVHRFVVRPGTSAENASLGDLPLPEDAWISLVIRSGRLVPVRADTVLRAGDEVVMLAPSEEGLTELFG